MPWPASWSTSSTVEPHQGASPRNVGSRYDHYFADFSDDGSFQIGTVTGFSPMFDAEENMTFLEPVLGGGFFVEGNVFVPEPSRAALADTALLGLALARRR